MVECKARCNRTLECGHSCAQLCYLDCKSNCTCGKSPAKREPGPVNYAKAVTGSPEKKKKKKPPISPKKHRPPTQDGSLQRVPRTGSWQHVARDLSDESQPYRDFAEGGYIQADKDLADLAAQQAADARKKASDLDEFEKLFAAEIVVPKKEKDKMTLVRQVDGGTRSVWKGTYAPLKSPNKSPNMKKEKEEVNLIDL